MKNEQLKTVSERLLFLSSVLFKVFLCWKWEFSPAKSQHKLEEAQKWQTSNWCLVLSFEVLGHPHWKFYSKFGAFLDVICVFDMELATFFRKKVRFFWKLTKNENIEKPKHFQRDVIIASIFGPRKWTLFQSSEQGFWEVFFCKTSAEILQQSMPNDSCTWMIRRSIQLAVQFWEKIRIIFGTTVLSDQTF